MMIYSDICKTLVKYVSYLTNPIYIMIIAFPLCKIHLILNVVYCMIFSQLDLCNGGSSLL